METRLEAERALLLKTRVERHPVGYGNSPMGPRKKGRSLVRRGVCTVIGNLRNSVRLRELEDEGFLAEIGGPQFSPAETRPSGELSRTGTKHSCCPFGVRQCTRRQSFQLFVQVVFDTPNCRNIPIQHQIRCTWVAVIWKSDTPGINKKFGNDVRLSNDRQMRVAKHHTCFTKATVDSPCLFVRCTRRECLPATMWGSMNEPKIRF